MPVFAFQDENTARGLARRFSQNPEGSTTVEMPQPLPQGLKTFVAKTEGIITAATISGNTLTPGSGTAIVNQLESLGAGPDLEDRIDPLNSTPTEVTETVYNLSETAIDGSTNHKWFLVHQNKADGKYFVKDFALSFDTPPPSTTIQIPVYTGTDSQGTATYAPHEITIVNGVIISITAIIGCVIECTGTGESGGEGEGCGYLGTSASQFTFPVAGVTSTSPETCDCSPLNATHTITNTGGCNWVAVGILEENCQSFDAEFTHLGEGTWELTLSTAIYRVTDATWDGQSPLTLTFVSDSDVDCDNWPATITITPV